MTPMSHVTAWEGAGEVWIKLCLSGYSPMVMSHACEAVQDYFFFLLNIITIFDLCMHIKVWITEVQSNDCFDIVLIYCTSTSIGLPTSEPPTTPTETMPPITTQPPISPLMVSFMGNTSLVVLNTVTVHVFTNKPDSATCHLGRAVANNAM